jgi:hypothetical protein
MLSWDEFNQEEGISVPSSDTEKMITAAAAPIQTET